VRAHAAVFAVMMTRAPRTVNASANVSSITTPRMRTYSSLVSLSPVADTA